MHKYLILAIVILFTALNFPQQQKKYFDAPFGGGIGYVPAWYIPNLAPVNVELKSIRDARTFDKRLLFFGRCRIYLSRLY